jgi:Alginate export
MFLVAAPLQAQDDPLSLGHKVSSWLEIGAAVRVRSELETLLLPGDDVRGVDTFSRARLGIRATPSSWLQFTVQLQDSRTLSGPEFDLEDLDNHADAQYAYMDVGPQTDGPWRIRAGRQPLAFGDERLIGADTAWDNRTQRFDGVRLTFKRREWHWDLFSVSPTTVLPTNPDRFVSPERLNGFYGTWSKDRVVFEPYLLWRQAFDQHSNLITTGFRMTRRLPRGLDAVVENALQRGGVAGSPVAAWAGYGELGYRPGTKDLVPRVALSYSYASGDRNRNDGKIGTFNDLYPAGYNECGFFEPFAWRNLQDLKLGATWMPGRKWTAVAAAHAYWLATMKDGVYADEGPYVAYDPAAPSSRLGSRLLVMAQHPVTSHGTLAFGYSKFWAAEYLKKYASLSSSAFVSISFGF